MLQGGNEVSHGKEQTELVIQLPQDRRDDNIAVTFPFSQVQSSISSDQTCH